MISRTTITQLIERPGLYLSLLMPTEQKGRETRENPIRFKNRLREAEAQLEAAGFKADARAALLAPARALLQDTLFWQHQHAGLALYLTPEGMTHYQLPLPVPERTVISRYPYVKPLAPIFAADGRFFVLVAGLGDASLYEATRYAMFELPLDELAPTSLAEHLQYDVEHKTLAAHATPSGLLYHGHSDDQSDKEKLLNYFKQLDNGVRKLLAGEQAPLVFAGLRHHFGLYQLANHYPYLLDACVDRDAEALEASELHRRAWQLVAPRFERQQAARERLAQPGVPSSSALEEVVLAALDGRVEVLWVSSEDLWGTFDAERRAVTVTGEASAESDDLLNVAAALTLKTGGEVYTLPPAELPKGEPITALYRF